MLLNILQFANTPATVAKLERELKQETFAKENYKQMYEDYVQRLHRYLYGEGKDTREKSFIKK